MNSSISGLTRDPPEEHDFAQIEHEDALPAEGKGDRRRCVRCNAPVKSWSRSRVCWRCMAVAGVTAGPGRKEAPVLKQPSEPPRTEIPFGDYILEREIAHGGMGVVFRARQVSLGRTVAVKLLLLGRHASTQNVERFRREARSAAALRHPNIVAIHEVGQWDGQHFFSMEYVEGKNLAETLRDGPLPAQRAAEVACTLAQAIHYAHQQGVLHRDLKPSNVLIDDSGQVRITDFGLAKRLDGSNDLTITGQMVGTPNYLPPEVVVGGCHSEIGPSSDVYGIGALLYELLTGRPPFLAQSLAETLIQIRDNDPPSPRLLNPTIARDLETICLKALEKDPARRYDSARSLAEDLGRWLRGEPIHARPSTFLERSVKWACRQPWLAIMLAATLLAMVATFGTLAAAYVRVSAARQNAQAKAEESRQRLVRLNVLSGTHFVANGDLHGALLWFVEAMRLDDDAERQEVHRRRFASVLRQAPHLATLGFHDAFVIGATFSDDGERILTISDDGLARLWDAEKGLPLRPPLPHPTGFIGAFFTADENLIITACWDGVVRRWDLRSGEAFEITRELVADFRTFAVSRDGQWSALRLADGVQLRHATNDAAARITLPASAGVREVQFSGDSRKLVGICSNDVIRLWEVPSGQPWGAGIQAPARVKIVSFDPAGERLAAAIGAANEQVMVWNAFTGKLLLAPFQPGGDLYDCRFSPDGHRVVIASWDGEARVFDTATGLPVGDSMRHRRGVSQSTFSDDNRLLATASWDGTARLWDPRSGAPVSPPLRQAGYVRFAVFSPDGRRLVTGGQDHTIRIWELGREGRPRLELRHAQAIRHASFSRDGRRILTAGLDGVARIWDRASGQSVWSMNHQEPIHDAVFSSNSRFVATASHDGTVRVWDVRLAAEACPPLVHRGPVYKVRFSPDSTRLVTASGDRTARVWSARTGSMLLPPLEHNSAVKDATFSPDGRYLVTGSADGTAIVWDAVSGICLTATPPHDGEIHSVDISSDGRRFVTAPSDGTQLARGALVWSLPDGQQLTPTLMHMDGVLHVAFSPDSHYVVTTSEDTSAMVWNAATGAAITPPLRHRAYVLHAAFSPDSQLLLTVSHDNTARVWDVTDGEPVTPPLHHDGVVTSGAWSPDGREILTASEDGKARVWDVAPTDLPMGELRRLAELLSAHRLESDRGMVPLTTEGLRQRWRD